MNLWLWLELISMNESVNIQVNSDLIQMQLLRQLSKEEQEEFARLRGCQNGTDEKTYNLCLKYFTEYKLHCDNSISDKLQIVMKAALFVAQKSQRIQTVKGERISLPSLTLNQLLKSHQPDQVMITLKEFSKKVSIADKQAASDLHNIIKEMSFLFTFHKKFEKSIERMELKERSPQSVSPQYIKNWSSFAWLLYIQVKNKAFHKSFDLIQNTCMLAHTLAFMLTFAWDYLIPKAILKQEKRINEQSSRKEVTLILRDRVMEMFSIKTMDVYSSIAGKLEMFFENDLIIKGIIKNSPQADDFFSPELLPQNYKRLDKLYEKTMDINALDERIFFKQRLANLTPSKFTPFARQGYANKGRRVHQNDINYKQNYSSHRILNYEMMDKLQTTMKGGNQGLNIGKLPKAVLVSPSSTMKVPLICQTPITTGMEMYNYVTEKNRKFRELVSQGQVISRPNEINLVKYISEFVEMGKKDFDRKTKQIREGLIESMFKLVLEDYLVQHPSEVDNESIYSAFMALSIEIVLFVCNSSVTFSEIENQMNASSLDMWKACDFYAKFDKAMPSSLKMHLIDLEASYLTHKLWKESPNLEMIARIARGEKDREAYSSRSEFGDRLFRKLLVQTAFQINQLASSLGLEEFLTQKIFETLKIIYTDHIYMLQNHNIDQLIMCAMFACNKCLRQSLQFRDIIDHYAQLNQYNKEEHDGIIQKIPNGENQTMNLIQFYNSIFVPPLKETISSMINSGEQKKVGINPLLQSPLKEVLPRELNKKNIKKALKDQNTNLLISYNDSPLLKHQPLSFKGAHHPKTRKMIDFEHQQKEFKEEKMKQYEKLSPKALTNDYSRKGSANGNYNLPWKAPQPGQTSQTLKMNGVTPTRINKNIANQGNFELNQFTTNPTPPISAKLGAKQASISGAYVKTSARMNYP